MPKRVTLYVHDDVLEKLELVPNKSGLVNELLRAFFKRADEEKPKKEGDSWAK